MGMEKASVARRMPVDIALVVFGIDSAKKRHASRFGSACAPVALKAARSMGMRTLRVISDEQRQIAMKLPPGKVSPKGKAVVPLVRPALYDKLLAVAGDTPTNDTPAVPPADGGQEAPSPPPASNGKPKPGDDWSCLVAGSVVLAKESVDQGWFECVVQNMDGDTLTLRWQGWPDLPKFNRKLTQVALLHPQMVKPC